MKKLLIGLCAASILAVGAGYAGTVTFVNKYDGPVTFVVSDGPFYKPIAGGTLEAGGQSSMYAPGQFDVNTYFYAFPVMGSPVVSGCGRVMGPTDSITVKAGWSRWTDRFSCRIYLSSDYTAKYSGNHVCHRHHHHF